jgi:hypothetical protein
VSRIPTAPASTCVRAAESILSHAVNAIEIEDLVLVVMAEILCHTVENAVGQRRITDLFVPA